MKLTSLQTAAIRFIEKYAFNRRVEALQAIHHILRMANIPLHELTHTVEEIKEKARVVVHFHPDRLTHRGLTVAESLLQEGYYKNQFDTRISNGQLAYQAGGARDRWECDFFNLPTSIEIIEGIDRPKYGALDLLRSLDGPSPRFGSCYFILAGHVSHRCTFSYLDSHKNPREKGTFNEFDDILAALLTESFERNYALGYNNLPPQALIERLNTQLSIPYENLTDRPRDRNLDHYIEAQIHGSIDLRSDVAMLVADLSFKETAIGRQLLWLGDQYKIPLLWKAALEMPVSQVPSNFRGATMPSLAKRIAPKQIINAYVIGEAARDLKLNPQQWADRGTYEQCLQELKLLWHVLIKFGNV